MDELHSIDSSLTATNGSWQIQGFDITDNYIGAVAYEEKAAHAAKIVVLALQNKIKDLMVL